jgi:hypothetical protein
MTSFVPAEPEVTVLEVAEEAAVEQEAPAAEEEVVAAAAALRLAPVGPGWARASPRP